MIKGVKATTVQEDLDIVVREVKNCPIEYDKTERVLLIDADSIMYFATHFPEESLMDFPTEEDRIEELAEMLSGKDVKASARLHARELRNV